MKPIIIKHNNTFLYLQYRYNESDSFNIHLLEKYFIFFTTSISLTDIMNDDKPHEVFKIQNSFTDRNT